VGWLVGRVVALDVETPNHRNDRVCSIGLTIIDDGMVAESRYYLVNPECDFDWRNISIHGVRPDDVADAPTFPRVWEEIGHVLRSNLVAAHNASFDLGVLNKVFAAYRMAESPLQYVCTMHIARAERRDLGSYGLAALCDSYGIRLSHHDARSDSRGCAELLCRFVDSGVDLGSYIAPYDFAGAYSEPARQSSPPVRMSDESQSLLVLRGILSGIAGDGVLNEQEVIYLQSWLNDNSDLRGNFPYDRIYATVSQALADGVLDDSELTTMLRLFQQVIDPVAAMVWGGHQISVAGKNVCLTGDFDSGGKTGISGRLVSMGACVQETVTLKTDYLVVGGRGSSAWAGGNYGNKVKKALEMQSKGSGIQVLREADFLAALDA
jgi:DNA polymerase-3 subunit epsilon